MSIYFKLLNESIRMAWNALVVNKLRTILSLLGITIGILAIISVFTLVDSMERNIRENVQSLGDNTVYVQKWPWATGTDYAWWKYWQRPQPTMDEFKEIQRRSNAAGAVVFQVSSNKTVEHGSNLVENVSVVAVTHDYDRIKSFNIALGRYFTLLESNSGKNVCIIGMAVAQGLFGKSSPIGQPVKLYGRKLTVIGVFDVEGESIFGNSLDNQVLMPVNFAQQLIKLDGNSSGPMVMVRGKQGVATAQLKDELRGIMRGLRRLKPLAEDNFALNEVSKTADYELTSLPKLSRICPVTSAELSSKRSAESSKGFASARSKALPVLLRSKAPHPPSLFCINLRNSMARAISD